MLAADMALWYCLRLPSCGHQFESQANHLHFFQFVLLKLWEKDENKQKGGRDWPISKLKLWADALKSEAEKSV